jgi:upstream activation factor subunit UAF30
MAGVKKSAARVRNHERRRPTGIQQPVQPDSALAAIVGNEAQPRSELTRRIWSYIKEHRLQDPSDRRMIRADDRLRPLFAGKPAISMFEMTRLMSRHVH